MFKSQFRIKVSKSGSGRDVTVIHVRSERPIPPAKNSDEIVTLVVRPQQQHSAFAEVAASKEE